MKKLLLVLSLCLSTVLANANELEIDPTPIVSMGVRFGSEDASENPAGYLSLKMSFLKMGEDTKIAFLTPGIGFQSDFNSDNKLNISISPISIELDYGPTFGLDYFLTKGGEKGHGSLGFFLGTTF